MGIFILGQITDAIPPLPEEGNFFSLAKLIVMLIFVFLWAWPASWCSSDAKRLSLNQFMWGLILVTGGVLGWFFWFIIPMYAVGMLFFLMLGFGSILVYALYRDSIVEEKDKILRVENIIAAIRGESQVEFQVEEKVRLARPSGQEPKIPDDVDQQQIYQSVQNLMFDALWRRVNEIYIQPSGDKTRVLFRIDGVISEYDHWERGWGQAVIDFLKSVGGMDIQEHRHPQKAKLVAQQVDVERKVGLDMETSGSTAGERLLILIRAEEARFTIDDTGFTKPQLKQFKKVLDTPRGIVILSGMSKAGVSTTLYAIARSVDAFTQNIHSVEQKPLMALDNITQNIYHEGDEEEYPKLIRSVSRREPDIIMVDPCPDSDTAVMIGEIAHSKGKKIYATLRASGTQSAVGRMVRWINSADIAGDVLTAVTFQRLVRKLCPACREAYKPNPETLRKMNLASKQSVTFYRPPAQMVDKKGNPIICPTCQGTGYLGRTAVYELLIIDEQLRGMIKTGDPVKIKAAVKKKIISWDKVALEKVVEGITSVQEIVRVSKEANQKK